MKKAAISIITCICMLVGMLSFSLPVNAVSYVAVPGSCFFYTYRDTSSSPALSVTFKDDGNLSGISRSNLFKQSIAPGLYNSWWYAGEDVKFFLNKTIPAGARLHINLGLRYWAATSNNVNAESLTFVKFKASFNNPASYVSASPYWSVREYIKTGSFDKEAYFNISIVTQEPISSINLTDVGAQISVEGSEDTYRIWLYLMDCRVQYELIDDNPNGDVLKDIRTNTNNTINAVNQQTTTITNNIQNQTDTMTNGYDNSSMSDDNTRLNTQIAQYDQAQESATNTSVSNIDAAEFINPSSNTSVFAAMTFSASFLQSLYNNLGDFGVVVMVSLSLCLGLMLVGWFKYRKGG